MKNFISIIITTKNEEKNIGNILESIKNQTVQDFEVIVVDNHSTDKTMEISEKYNVLFFTKGPERSAQRNYGVSKANGNYVLILDADMILEKGVVQELLHQLSVDKDLKTLTIKEEPMGSSFWAKCKRLELEFYSSNPDSKTHAARCFEKKVFEEFNGYDTDLTGPEDWDLPERINKKFPKKYFTVSKIFHNEGDYGLWRILKKKFYYAQKSSTYISKHNMKLTDSKFVYFFRPEFYRFWRLWFKNIFTSIGLIFMLSLETIAGALGFFIPKLNVDKFPFIENKIFKFLLNKKYLILSVIINIFINYRFFLGKYFFTGDNPNIVKDLLPKVFPITLISDYNYIFTSRTAETGRILLHNFLYTFYKLFDLNWNTSFQTFFIILPWIVFGSIYTYLISEMYSKSKIVPIISAIFFVNSSYFISSLYMGHIFLVVANSFIPMFFYYYLKYGLEKLKLTFIVFLLTISSVYDIRFVVISFLLIFSIELSKGLYLKNIKNLILFFKISVIFTLINIYWIVPEILMRLDEKSYDTKNSTVQISSTTPNLLERGFFGGVPNDITFSLLNQHPFIDFSNFKIFSKSGHQVLLYALPLFFILSIYFYTNTKDKLPVKPAYFYSILFSFITFILLSKINSFPFLNSYDLLDGSFKIFTSIFREGTRFYPVISILYIYFISLFFYFIKDRKNLFYLFLTIYFLSSIYFIFVSQKIDLKNNLDPLNHEFTRIFKSSDQYTILSVKNNFNENLYPGNEKARIILLDQYTEVYFNNPIEECSSNLDSVNVFSFKFNIRYIVFPKDFVYNNDCFSNFSKINTSEEVSSRFIILKNNSTNSLFYDNNLKSLEYYDFLNIFYSIKIPEGVSEVNTSAYFHPSWRIYIDDKNLSAQIKLSKNEINGLKLELPPHKNTEITLIFYPQLILYILFIPITLLSLYVVFKLLKYGFIN